ncbi:MAG: hypothetical protein AAB834_06230, partial [Patescibacteria group bacterium]
AAVVARHLGASMAVARQLGEYLAVVDVELMPLAYKPPSTCYDGGPYDLQPDFPGNFPHLAPITVKMG